MDHESALDVAEPQSLTDDPLMLHGNGHSRTLVLLILWRQILVAARWIKSRQ